MSTEQRPTDLEHELAMSAERLERRARLREEEKQRLAEVAAAKEATKRQRGGPPEPRNKPPPKLRRIDRVLTKWRAGLINGGTIEEDP